MRNLRRADTTFHVLRAKLVWHFKRHLLNHRNKFSPLIGKLEIFFWGLFEFNNQKPENSENYWKRWRNCDTGWWRLIFVLPVCSRNIKESFSHAAAAGSMCSSMTEKWGVILRKLDFNTHRSFLWAEHTFITSISQSIMFMYLWEAKFMIVINIQLIVQPW